MYDEYSRQVQQSPPAGWRLLYSLTDWGPNMADLVKRLV
jgi:hypothetical protein